MPFPFPIPADLLAGHVAVVTGGARGNGLAIARALVRAGARVALLDRDREAVEAAARSIEAPPASVMSLAADVGDRQACAGAAERVAETLGTTSILVNNAGILRRDGLDSELFDQTFDEIMRINVTGSVNMVRALRKQLVETRGRVLNIGSITSFAAARAAVAYVSSKGAVLQMTKAMAMDLGPDGIRVNGLAPGRIATDMTAGYRDDPEIKAAYFARAPLARYGEPEDLAGPALFLLSDWSGYVTGVMLPVDGGFLAS